MTRKRKPRRPDREPFPVESLAPWPTLGYDRDRIALHLIERDAFEVAEAELRRAVELNPYEPSFKLHLAWCLHRAKKDEEARDWARSAAEQDPSNPQPRELLEWIESALRRAVKDTRAGERADDGV